MIEISIHALLAESDGGVRSSCFGRTIFLSTLSLRRATARRALGFVDPDISIHALLAESDIQDARACLNILISIHALLAESDNEDRYGQQFWRISIHALLAESDHLLVI